MTGTGPLGHPRLHLRRTTSTNERARALAAGGAPHGTLVTAAEQTAGRGRQGRTWTAPPGRGLLCSVVVRDPPRLLPLAAGAAVADAVDRAVAGSRERPRGAQIKWPNDVLLRGGKVAGILVEGRPQERWAVVGIGLNVAVAPSDFPPELAGRAATLGLGHEAIEPTLRDLLARLEHWLAADAETLLAEIRARDALLGRPVRWAGEEGRGDGIDGDGRLVVITPGGGRVALDAGEVHLRGPEGS
ncbi:MAG TPA: biotin--[acetyl-CoA-carboxylase] ligase [Solirubrobacteraceae bacterium]|jgi:BirA family biotin operon repressor/biotin-[acetyl-CoA-carboxylase] ligase|nr:biotin--[acetyl-CoA-carboxylase] ligase [Solirubrobacteraceae bacterium]